MGANGPDPLFAYRVLSAKRPWPLPELGGRMHDEQCGRFLRTMIFAASTPAQRSYALGFLAHYAADSVMHPYVAFQCGPQGQFNIPEGHGFCEVAMDSMFHEQDSAHPPFRRELPLGAAASGAGRSDANACMTRWRRSTAWISRMRRWRIPSMISTPCTGCSCRLTAASGRWSGRRNGWCCTSPATGFPHDARPAPGGRLCGALGKPLYACTDGRGPRGAVRGIGPAGCRIPEGSGRLLGGPQHQEALAAAVGDRSYSTGLLSEPAPAGGEGPPCPGNKIGLQTRRGERHIFRRGAFFRSFSQTRL